MTRYDTVGGKYVRRSWRADGAWPAKNAAGVVIGELGRQTADRACYILAALEWELLLGSPTSARRHQAEKAVLEMAPSRRLPDGEVALMAAEAAGVSVPPEVAERLRAL